MDWNSLKTNEDSKSKKKIIVAEIISRATILHQECENMYSKFGEISIRTKKSMEGTAIQDFQLYFQNKGFNVTGDNINMSAIYGDVNVLLTNNGDFGYTIHIYNGKDLNDCRVFNIELAEEFNDKYKQLYVENIKDDTTVELLNSQVKTLESNKKSISNLIKDIDKVKFVFNVDKYHSGISGEFPCIEEILDTF